jgi:hypothetical protein
MMLPAERREERLNLDFYIGSRACRASKAHASQHVRRNPTIENCQLANHPPITHLRFYTASVGSGYSPKAPE